MKGVIAISGTALFCAIGCDRAELPIETARQGALANVAGELRSEELAREHGVPSELVPSPPQAHARCNLALTTFAADGPRLTGLLEREGVPFGIYHPPASD